MARRFGIGAGVRPTRPRVPSAQAGGTTVPPGYKSPGPRTGGTQYPPGYKPSVPSATSGLTAPPFLTYDPAIEAQRRAAERGLEDTEAKLKTEGHFQHTDLVTAMRNLKRTAHYKRTDIGTTFNRGTQRLGYQEADTKQQAQRTGEDFQTKLATIARQFGELGQRQGEAANAAGVNDAGTGAASAVVRGRNQGFAEAPIHTAQARLGEDLAQALGRIGTARGQLSEDQSRSLGRLQQDVGFERGKAKREFGQDKFTRQRELEQARREQAIANQNLLEQEIYSARQNRPGVFSRTGAKKKGK
jgi:hypothetical protein